MFLSLKLVFLLNFIFIIESIEENNNKTSKSNEDLYVPCDQRSISAKRPHKGKDRQNLCKVECFTQINNPGFCQIHALNPCKTLDQSKELMKCPSNSGGNSLFESICCPFKNEKQQNVSHSGHELGGTPGPVVETVQGIGTPVPGQPSLVSVSENCGQRPNIAAIVGGVDAQPNTWPWIVSIYEKQTPRSQPRFLCGGALINNNYILSAAHCFVRTGSGRDRVRPERFLIKVGAHRLSDRNIKLQSIAEVIPHKNYNSVQHYYDIALVRVRNKIEFNPTVAPICLPNDQLFNQREFVGHQTKLIGWGATRFGGSVSDDLQEVDVNIIDNNDCNRNYSSLNGHSSGFPEGINKQLICAGLQSGGKDSCQGDSGGPLALELNGKWYELGIVSFGYKCAEPGFPGIYTKVKHFMDWIQTNTK